MVKLWWWLISLIAIQLIIKMLLLRRFAIYLSGLLILLNFELFILFPHVWYIFLLIALILPLITVAWLNGLKFDQNFLGFSATPLFFLLSNYLFLLFLEDNLLKQVIIIGGGLLYTLLLSNVFIYLYRTAKYRSYSLENISNYLNLVAVFFIFTSAFSFYVLAVGRLRYMLILVFLTALALSWQTLWINKINDSRNKFFIFILSISLTEMYWALHYWPTSFFVNGLILSIVFYLALNLMRHHLIEALTKRLALRYVIISGIIIVATLATAQWT